MSEQKRGEAYVHSAEKRRFDFFVATSLLPIELGFRAIARTQVPPDQSVIFKQTRMGARHAVFDVRKMRTLKADGTTISPIMEKFRSNGIDELPQLLNILRGEMSVVGRRPLLPDEYVEQYEIVGSDLEGSKLVDLHKKTAGIAKPGLLGTHGIQAHRGEESVLNPASRLELDIQDFHAASREHTLKLVRTVLSSIQNGEMNHGSIRLVDPGISEIS